MPPGLLAGIGAAAGGILGGIGSFFAKREEKKAFRRFRRRQASAISQAREFADERVQSILSSPLLSGATSFVERTFGDPGGSPLAEDLRKSLRVAQQARGLRRSTAGAVAEASALAGFQQQLRAQLLPQATALGTLPEQLRQNIIGFEAPLRIAAGTGLSFTGFQAPPGLAGGFAGAGGVSSILSQSTQGAFGGANLGLGIENQLASQAENARLLDILQQQARTRTRQQPGGDVLDLLNRFGRLS